MVVRFVVISLCFLLSSTVKSDELKHSAGIGLPYSGLVGYQLSYISEDKHRLRGAIGLIGIGAGYDYKLDEHWSIGATYTASMRSVYSANLTYHFHFFSDGLKLGLDLGYMPNDDTGEGFFSSDGSKTVIWLNLGYAL